MCKCFDGKKEKRERERAEKITGKKEVFVCI